MRAPFVLVATLLAIVVVTLVSPTASAHGMRTAYLEVTEGAPGVAAASFQTTANDPLVTPRFPAGCAVETTDPPGARQRAYVVRCEGPLTGREIGVDGLGPVISEAVVRVALSDGGSASGLVTREQPTLLLRARASRPAVAGEYVKIGIEHILTGPDHLLFLLALVLYLRRPRQVLAAETAFTVSHSLSFSATALGLVHVAPRAAEACIALSLVLLAAEVVRRRDEAPSTLAGALSALVFGLVHGLGFAGGLGAIGVPDDAAAVALVGFGVGVELGQLAFLAVVLVVAASLTRLVRPARLGLAGGYVVGVAGAFWLFERLWLCFP